MSKLLSFQRKPFRIRAMRFQGQVKVDIATKVSFGKSSLQDGDWIVAYENGKCEVLAHEVFCEKFEAVCDEGQRELQGTAKA